MHWRRILTEAGLLLGFAVAVGAVSNAFRPEAKKLAWAAYRPAARATTASPAERTAVPSLPGIAPAKDPGLLFLDISSHDARRLHEAGALFLDARRSAAYESSHIAGARSMPVWEHDIDARVAALAAGGAPSDRVIVIYCSGGRCEDSARLAEKLSLAGFFNLYAYKDGFPDWQSRGWPVERERK